MRPEVQEILDKEWPDRKTPKGRPVYGSNNKSIALVRVAMHAEDCGDEELYDEAVAQAEIIPETNPNLDRKFVKVIFPQYHTFMHDTRQKLVTFKEKHGDWSFVTNNAYEFSMAMLSIVNSRLEDGWYLDELYGDDAPKEGEDPNQTDMFKSNKTPKTDAEKAQAMIDLARSDEPGCVIKAGKFAYEFLQDHCDNQYESFEVDYPSKADFDLTPK